MTTTQNDTIEGIQARADYLVETCDGGPTFKAELKELASDVKAALTNEDRDNGGKHDDEREPPENLLWEYAADLASVKVVAEMAASKGDDNLQLEGTLYLISREADRLNDAIGEVAQTIQDQAEKPRDVANLADPKPALSVSKGGRDKAIDNLEATQKALWNVAGMISVLATSDESRLEDGELESFAEAMQTVLSPTYEAVENGVKQLRADALGGTAAAELILIKNNLAKEPPNRNDDAATAADVAFDRFQARCNKMPTDQVALELRAHCWEADEILSASMEEDGYRVSKTFTRKGLKHFLAEREFLQSLLPEE
jgi:hypothetical protein